MGNWHGAAAAARADSCAPPAAELAACAARDRERGVVLRRWRTWLLEAQPVSARAHAPLSRIGIPRGFAMPDIHVGGVYAPHVVTLSMRAIRMHCMRLSLNEFVHITKLRD